VRRFSERNGKELNLEPIARLVNFAYSAEVEPRIMGIGHKQYQSIEARKQGYLLSA
jgi:hypothetical protein